MVHKNLKDETGQIYNKYNWRQIVRWKNIKLYIHNDAPIWISDLSTGDGRVVAYHGDNG